MRAILAALVTAFLLGCGSVSTRSTVLASYETMSDFTQRTTKLVRAGVISTDEAERRKRMIEQAKVALDAARAGIVVCDLQVSPSCTSGEPNIQLVRRLMVQLEDFLIEQESKR